VASATGTCNRRAPAPEGRQKTAKKISAGAQSFLIGIPVADAPEEKAGNRGGRRVGEQAEMILKFISD
jgi:hypothetical protein